MVVIDRCDGQDVAVHCAMTGEEHRLFWLRSAWWCSDCHQKIETCCEGGGCPSVSELAVPAAVPDPGADRQSLRPAVDRALARRPADDALARRVTGGRSAPA